METKIPIIFIKSDILETELFVGDPDKNIQGYYFNIDKSDDDEYSFRVQMRDKEQIKYQKNIKNFFEALIDMSTKNESSSEIKEIEYFQKKHIEYFGEFESKFTTSYISHDDLLYLKNKGAYIGIFGSKIDAGTTEVIDNMVKKAVNKIHFTLKFSHFESTDDDDYKIKPPADPSTSFAVPCPPRWDETKL